MDQIKPDAMSILTDICLDINDNNALNAYHDIKLIDDLLKITKVKSLINLSRGRRKIVEKRYEDIIRARILQTIAIKSSN